MGPKSYSPYSPKRYTPSNKGKEMYVPKKFHEKEMLVPKIEKSADPIMIIPGVTKELLTKKLHPKLLTKELLTKKLHPKLLTKELFTKELLTKELLTKKLHPKLLTKELLTKELLTKELLSIL